MPLLHHASCCTSPSMRSARGRRLAWASAGALRKPSQGVRLGPSGFGPFVLILGPQPMLRGSQVKVLLLCCVLDNSCVSECQD
eukprot:scaffold224741_cov25-Tisochrysis_lutea.AAC.1